MPKVLLVRHPTNRVDFYKVWWDWVGLNVPSVMPHLELRLLPCELGPETTARACVLWLQDPVEDWSLEAYRDAMTLADDCRKIGCDVVNPVDQLANACKFEGGLRISRAGFRTPRIVRITDAAAFREDAGGLPFPLCIREDRGHQKPMLRVDDWETLREVSLEGFESPIAVEVVDVRGSDGLYRKYRYVAAGEHGVAHHLQITPGWVTRGDDRVINDATKAEERAYIEGPDPHHERFQAARRELGLDFVAFDYGYDSTGAAVVWEANPYPFIRFCSSSGGNTYRHAPMHRTLAAMLALYLERAGIPVPAEVRTIIDVRDPSSSEVVARLRPPVAGVNSDRSRAAAT